MKRLLIVDPRPESRDHLLRQWKHLGYHLTGVTPVAEASGLGVCDEIVIAAFTSFEHLLNLLQAKPAFDGVVCYHQAAIGIANRLAHALGLPPMWASASADLSNKRVLQSVWERAGLRVPRCYADVPEITSYPVVIKPAGLQGQIGVRICRSADEAKEWIQLIRRTTVPFKSGSMNYEMIQLYGSDREPLIQEYIESDRGAPFECSAEFFVKDGVATYLGGFEKTSVEDPDLPNEELLIFPLVHESKIEVNDLTTYIAATGFQNGFCHFEYKIAGGQIVPIELNARLIGAPGDRCLNVALEIDCADLMARAACGLSLSWDWGPKSEHLTKRWVGFAKIHLPRRFENRMVKSFSIPEFSDALLRIENYIKPNEPTELWESCVGAPIGMVHIEAFTRVAAQNIVAQLGSSLKFEF